jgi:hypothetical protein
MVVLINQMIDLINQMIDLINQMIEFIKQSNILKPIHFVKRKR